MKNCWAVDKPTASLSTCRLFCLACQSFKPCLVRIDRVIAAFTTSCSSQTVKTFPNNGREGFGKDQHGASIKPGFALSVAFTSVKPGFALSVAFTSVKPGFALSVAFTRSFVLLTLFRVRLYRIRPVFIDVLVAILA